MSLFKEETLKQAEEKGERLNEEIKKTYGGKLDSKFPQYRTDSRIQLKHVYSITDIKDMEIDFPGAYPYTRGLYPLQYQYQPWMIQMLHGYGTAKDTRRRTNQLIQEGMVGYKGHPVVLFETDPPTTAGYHPDDPQVRDTIGLTGPSMNTLNDLDALLHGFDLAKTRVAWVVRFTDLPLLAMYLVYGDSRGYEPYQLSGQTQNFPAAALLYTNLGGPAPDVGQKLSVELIKYVAKHMPRWNHTNLSGYVPGEWGISPSQELGLVMAQAVELIEDCIQAGLEPDEFVPRFSSHVALRMDFFEEIAKLRAWRRMWAKIMKERFGCRDERSLRYRIHVQTSGSVLTREQPLNNIARTTLQVLASVIGGVQSIATASYDEAVSLPTEEAVRIAIMVNQIILHESGVARVTDPLGGSYYLEWLTDKVEEEARKLMAEIEEKGGFVNCIKSGWLRGLFAKQIIDWRKQIDIGERVVVGVNKFRVKEEREISPFTLPQEEVQRNVLESLKVWKENRNNYQVKQALEGVKEAVSKYDCFAKAGNLMPELIEAVKAKCTLAEMMQAIYEASGGITYLT